MHDSDPKDERLKVSDRIKAFIVVHWRGVLTILSPIVFLFIILPAPTPPQRWVAYSLCNMAVYWVSECIPLAVTSFLPMIIFPLTGIMSTGEVCKAYVNDTILMFIGSLFMAYSIEQSGLHKRLAYTTIQLIGYSHIRLLMAMCTVTTFIAMWITNTAATTMMVPINFAILRTFEGLGLMNIYNTDIHGEKTATGITTCYFCAATYSSTIGGIGTLIGTATNLAFKGLFIAEYPTAPEYLSFPLFSAFGFPFMVLLEIGTFFYLAILYLGLFRPNSKAAKKARITQEAIEVAKKAIARDAAKLGRFTFWEFMVVILFFGAIICFFCRSPQIFSGWGDKISDYFGKNDDKYIRDSALATLICCAMFIWPRNLTFFKNITAKYPDELPKGRIKSVLDWDLLSLVMPWSFMFLLGGGFALSEGAKVSGLNARIGEHLKGLNTLSNPAIIIIITMIVMVVTNFASNVAIANVMVPIAIQIAKQVKVHPLWYCNVAGFCASFCFMMPVGTPGNLIVQSAASIPTIKMIQAGFGVVVCAFFLNCFLMYFYAPVVWPDLNTYPEWAQ